MFITGWGEGLYLNLSYGLSSNFWGVLKLMISYFNILRFINIGDD
jgi:hypothetical protein